MGVNDIRRNFQHQVNTINDILRKNVHNYNYTFIDNSNIQQQHLQKDGLHLRFEGSDILGNNFIDALKLRSHPSAFNNFY